MSLPPSPSPAPNPAWYEFLLPLWKTIAGFVIVLCGLATIGFAVDTRAYNMGKDAGQGALSVYDKAKEFKFEELATRAAAATADLQKASDLFKGILATNEEYVTARDQLAAARAMIKQHEELNAVLHQQHDEMAKSVAKVKKDLEDMTTLGRTYVIEKGKADIIEGGALNFGLHKVSSDLEAVIYVAGKERTTFAGDKFEIPGKNNTICTFNVKSVEWNKVPDLISVDAKCEKLGSSQ